MAITSANQLELLQTAEAVAREKMIDPGLVVSAMEKAWPALRNLAMAQKWTSAFRLIVKRSRHIHPRSHRGRGRIA